MKRWRVDWHIGDPSDSNDVLFGSDEVLAYDECDAYREATYVVRSRHGDVTVYCSRAKEMTHHESWKKDILP